MECVASWRKCDFQPVRISARRSGREVRRGGRVQIRCRRHLPGMSGKGLTRLALLVMTALLGAGLILAAHDAPRWGDVSAQPAAVRTPP